MPVCASIRGRAYIRLRPQRRQGLSGPEHRPHVLSHEHFMGPVRSSQFAWGRDYEHRHGVPLRSSENVTEHVPQYGAFIRVHETASFA